MAWDDVVKGKLPAGVRRVVRVRGCQRPHPNIVTLQQEDPRSGDECGVQQGGFDPLVHGVRPVSHGEVAPVVALRVEGRRTEGGDLYRGRQELSKRGNTELAALS